MLLFPLAAKLPHPYSSALAPIDYREGTSLLKTNSTGLAYSFWVCPHCHLPTGKKIGLSTLTPLL